MEETIYLVRGISGSGKSTLASIIYSAHISALGNAVRMIAADDFFYDGDGFYNFKPELLPEAHKWCTDTARVCMSYRQDVIVHNTFCQRWEMEPYISLAEKYSYRLIVASTYDGGCTDEQLAERNTHGVPLSVIRQQRDRWEMDWKNANTTPPWER